ncbi:hypothetical protein Ade02nite_19120 [Paractinoplanes deccanensis]|uniref:DUF7701 domain-containing protein n=1 Tax=Paractinoplanes deccanensis TaxID=113561 RepID=A0ABQ3XZU8_9ACTN|nr:hypothetical protein [Actinoplanes deccanensis]GID73271.1 hypothetical protein Ade02nite_19120 [Actinoplanes deccanensis]
MTESNYVQELRSEIAARLPNCDDHLIDLYTLLGLQYGTHVDEVHVHNAWAVHTNRTRPDHRSLIPFPFLAPEVQALDTKYVEAIRQADRAVYSKHLAAHQAKEAAR